MGVSGQRYAPVTLYSLGNDPRYPLDRRLGGPHSLSGHKRQEEKSFHLCWGSNPGCPVSGQTLYWLSYPSSTKQHIKIKIVSYFCLIKDCSTVLQKLNWNQWRQVTDLITGHSIWRDTFSSWDWRTFPSVNGVRVMEKQPSISYVNVRL
jgi:hypothetical protein